MILKFFGFLPEEINEVMPKLVAALSLGHGTYTVVPHEATILYNQKGLFVGYGQAIEIPGFAPLLGDSAGWYEQLSDLLQSNIVCSMTVAPNKAAINGKELK